jgi:hypothetical protein
MKQTVELYWSSLSKAGEELCGDNVRTCSDDQALIIVLSDGLGSGVKANILSTLTAQIAITMFEQGAQTDEVMATLADTLPECQTRKLAYATFAMLRVLQGSQAFLVEYDRPPIILVRHGQIVDLPKQAQPINARPVREAHFELQGGDYLVMVSDGYEHAGVGERFPLGWGWARIAERVCQLSASHPDSRALADSLAQECLGYYDGHPGDDATVVAMHVRPVVSVTIWTGPPADKALDERAVATLMGSPDTKVICGGTTAQIAARVLAANSKSIGAAQPQARPLHAPAGHAAHRPSGGHRSGHRGHPDPRQDHRTAGKARNGRRTGRAAAQR